MSLNERISKVLEYSGMTPSEFADAVDVQRSSISHITSGRNKPSLEFITKIKNRFPEIEWEWLITGDGEMRKENGTSKTEEQKPHSLPDLFSLIDNEDFGKSETATKAAEPKPRESDSGDEAEPEPRMTDSQGLGSFQERHVPKPEIRNAKSIRRIAIFFSDGTFESYEA